MITKALIYSDLDKTLLDDKQEISIENLKAIKMLNEKQIKLVLSTGRPYEFVKNQILKKYNLNLPVISLNGAQVFLENGKLLKKNILKNDSVLRIIKSCENKEIFSLLYTNKGIYTLKTKNEIKNLYKLGEKKSDKIETILYGMQVYYNIYIKEKRIDNDLNSKIETGEIDVYKIEICSHNADTLNEIKEKYYNDVYITRSNDINLEITGNNVTKGIMINILNNYYSVDRDNTYSIGDSYNDLEMIKSVKHGIAVENAIGELKELAEFVTPSYDKDGFSEFVYTFFK